MCMSLLMYLQNSYNITTTTDLTVLKSMAEHSDFDLILLDAEPSKKIERFCEDLRKIKADIPLILTYVYERHSKDFDLNVRKYANSVFYKPVDLNEVSKGLSDLILQ